MDKFASRFCDAPDLGKAEADVLYRVLVTGFKAYLTQPNLSFTSDRARKGS